MGFLDAILGFLRGGDTAEIQRNSTGGYQRPQPPRTARDDAIAARDRKAQAMPDTPAVGRGAVMASPGQGAMIGGEAQFNQGYSPLGDAVTSIASGIERNQDKSTISAYEEQEKEAETGAYKPPTIGNNKRTVTKEQYDKALENQADIMLAEGAMGAVQPSSFKSGSEIDDSNKQAEKMAEGASEEEAAEEVASENQQQSAIGNDDQGSSSSGPLSEISSTQDAYNIYNATHQDNPLDYADFNTFVVNNTDDSPEWANDWFRFMKWADDNYGLYGDLRDMFRYDENNADEAAAAEQRFLDEYWNSHYANNTVSSLFDGYDPSIARTFGTYQTDITNLIDYLSDNYYTPYNMMLGDTVALENPQDPARGFRLGTDEDVLDALVGLDILRYANMNGDYIPSDAFIDDMMASLRDKADKNKMKNGDLDFGRLGTTSDEGIEYGAAGSDVLKDNGFDKLLGMNMYMLDPYLNEAGTGIDYDKMLMLALTLAAGAGYGSNVSDEYFAPEDYLAAYGISDDETEG